ncbi:MAG: hypothetical protein IKB82_06675, partial [Clostridia bacterium]|nr:hypothetical protein [Clostridia bacterium]
SRFQSFLSCIAPILPQKCGEFNTKRINSWGFDKKTTGKIALDSFLRACYALISIGILSIISGMTDGSGRTTGKCRGAHAL